MTSVRLILHQLWAWRGVLLCAALVATVAVLAARCDYLGNMLDLREKLYAASVARETELRDKLSEAARALELANGATSALSELAEACMEREAEARADFAARTAIMTNVKPRPRTDAEAQEIVDDATRHAAAARLNRPW